MDAAWSTVCANFDKVIALSPDHAKVATFLLDTELESSPNVLFYGTPGFPIDLFVHHLLKRKFNITQVDNRCTWNNEVIYSENPSYFTIDFANPSQSKNVLTIGAFIKELVSHSSVHTGKHAMVLLNIDKGLTKENVYQFRVLLERYSNNVVFITTTYHRSKIESPLLSRLVSLRIPLLSTEAIRYVCNTLLDVQLPSDHTGRSLYHAVLVGVIAKERPALLPSITRFNVPAIADMKKPTHDQLRTLAQKIYINDVTIAMLTQDLLNIVSDPYKLVSAAAHIDCMAAKTDGHRMSIFIEQLLNIAFELKEKRT
jgi:hypothetical protein